MTNGARTQSALAGIGRILICASICIEISVRYALLTHNIGFSGDQTRDAYVYAGMREGQWPTLGPSIITTEYRLPPLYYYLVFPFTLLGPDPVWQVLPNALFSFLSLILLMIAVYQLTNGLPVSRRLLAVGGAGLWQSLLFDDIVLSTKEWNPSPIPCFLTAFVLLAAGQLRRRRMDRIALISWITMGILVAVLVSLHGSALYVMPAAFALLSFAFLFQTACFWQAAAMVCSGWLAAFASLAPYYKGELDRKWANTRAVISLAEGSARGHNFLSYINHMFLPYMQLSGQCYFPGGSDALIWAGFVFLIALLQTALLTFRGDRVLLGSFFCVWTLFLLIAGNRNAGYIHYKLLILQAPLILAAISIAGLHYRSLVSRATGVVLMFGALISMIANGTIDVQYVSNALGKPRLLAVSDTIALLGSLPASASVCKVSPEYEYIDKYVTRRRLRFTNSCSSGTYAIYPTVKGQGDFLYRGVMRFDGAVKASQIVPTTFPFASDVTSSTDGAALLRFR